MNLFKLSKKQHKLLKDLSIWIGKRIALGAGLALLMYLVIGTWFGAVALVIGLLFLVGHLMLGPGRSSL